MSTNPPVDAPAGGGPPRSGPSSSTGERIRDVIFVFLPTPVQKLFERGLFKTFLAVASFLVVFPVLVAYLAAFWVKTLGNFDNRYARALREEILTMVNEGFTVEEVANKVTTRSNLLLDYFQTLDEDISSRSVPVNKPLAVADWQKVMIDIEGVKLVPVDPNCTLSERAVDLVELSFGDVPIGTMKEGPGRQFLITGKTWSRVIEEGAPKRLTLTAGSAVRKVDCGEIKVHVDGAILVYKGSIPHEGASKP